MTKLYTIARERQEVCGKNFHETGKPSNLDLARPHTHAPHEREEPSSLGETQIEERDGEDPGGNPHTSQRAYFWRANCTKL